MVRERREKKRGERERKKERARNERKRERKRRDVCAQTKLRIQSKSLCGN